MRSKYALFHWGLQIINVRINLNNFHQFPMNYGKRNVLLITRKTETVKVRHEL